MMIDDLLNKQILQEMQSGVKQSATYVSELNYLIRWDVQIGLDLLHAGTSCT